MTVRVDRVLFGGSPGSQIVFRQLAREGDRTVIVDGVRTAEVGDRGIYVLLIDKAGPPRVFALMGGQGQYLVAGDGRLYGSDPSNPLVIEINRLTLDELRARVADAAARVERGEVRPAPGK